MCNSIGLISIFHMMHEECQIHRISCYSLYLYAKGLKIECHQLIFLCAGGSGQSSFQVSIKIKNQQGFYNTYGNPILKVLDLPLCVHVHVTQLPCMVYSLLSTYHFPHTSYVNHQQSASLVQGIYVAS